MQSRKAASKKTNKSASEAVVNEKKAAAEPTKKPRVPRSSQPKKKAETAALSTNSHQKAAVGAMSIPASESSLLAKTLPESIDPPKPMATAVGLGSRSSHPAVAIDPVGVVAAPGNGKRSQYSREDVAKLAYSYWIARGYSHGGAEEDWLRAEVELTGKH